MARHGRKSSRRTGRWRFRHLVAPHFLVGVSTVGVAIAAYAGTHTYLDFHAGGPDAASGCEGCRRTDRDTPPPASALAERPGEPAPEAGSRLRSPSATSPVRVVHRARTDGDGRFRSVLVLTNTGPKPVRHWRLTFTYPDGRVRTAAAARMRRGGRSPLLYGKGAHRTLAPGESVRVRLSGKGVAAGPYGCVLNGQACAIG